MAMIKSIFASLVALTITIAPTNLAHAQTYSVLYSFDGVPGDGIGPSGTLVQDEAGNLYGTTQVGGTNAVGTIFELTPAGVESVLYNFNLRPDAMLSGRGLFRDAAGNLFGVSDQGGAYGPKNGDGTVFKLDSTGNETVIHSFGKGKDGEFPNSELITDAKGNLYGVAGSGGTYGYGTVFKITPAGKEVKLHNFTGLDGSTPVPGLVLDAHGNLFGATIDGGAYGEGVVFKLARNGSYTIIYNFCALQNCVDGREPDSGVVLDPSGNLFGTTVQGGLNGQGTVYEITKSGEQIVLHNFGDMGSQDGRWPFAGLVRDSAGNLYGTTYIGGTYETGTIYKVDTAGNETVLHSFCAQPHCTDGATPFASLLRDQAGNLYGIASQGAYQAGLVFKLTP
jgi:uncharacterized repeat protein (TIGR03803 family)